MPTLSGRRWRFPVCSPEYTDDQAVVFANLHGVADCLYDSPEASLLLEVTAFLYKILALQKVNDNVIEVENNQLIFVVAFQILFFIYSIRSRTSSSFSGG